MTVKRPLTLSLLLLLTLSLSAQKVKWKDGFLLLDGKPTFAYEIKKGRGNKVFVYTNLKGDHELWQAHYCINRLRSQGDNYRHYYFPDVHMEMILPRKKKYKFAYILPKMLDRGVVDEKGNIDEAALRKFITRFHIPLPKSWKSPAHKLPVVNHESGKVHEWVE